MIPGYLCSCQGVSRGKMEIIILFIYIFISSQLTLAGVAIESALKLVSRLISWDCWLKKINGLIDCKKKRGKKMDEWPSSLQKIMDKWLKCITKSNEWSYCC